MICCGTCQAMFCRSITKLLLEQNTASVLQNNCVGGQVSKALKPHAAQLFEGQSWLHHRAFSRSYASLHPRPHPHVPDAVAGFWSIPSHIYNSARGVYTQRGHPGQRSYGIDIYLSLNGRGVQGEETGKAHKAAEHAVLAGLLAASACPIYVLPVTSSGQQISKPILALGVSKQVEV